LGDVRRRSRDRKQRPAADVDFSDLQPIGIRMFFERDDSTDDNAGYEGAANDLFDGKTQHRQAFGNRFGIFGQVDVLP
jgi:hypothetical protein